MTPRKAQEECKRRYPIGCKYKEIGGEEINILENDDKTYLVVNNTIYAHSYGGLLYKDGEFAELISLPESYKQPKPKKDDLKPLTKLLKCIK